MGMHFFSRLFFRILSGCIFHTAAVPEQQCCSDRYGKRQYRQKDADAFYQQVPHFLSV